MTVYNDGSMARVNEPCPLTTISVGALTMAAEDCTTKHCSKCGEPRPLTQFRKRKESRDGRAYECDLCRSARRRARYASDEAYRRRILDKQRSKNAADPEPNRRKVREWAAKNPEKVKDARTRHRRKDLAAYNAYQSNWGKSHKGTRNAATARRHASKLKATPPWADKKLIALLYKEAASIGLHVDHIVPLQSPLVCGLHVENNLQMLSQKENIQKNNRVWPDMP